MSGRTREEIEASIAARRAHLAIKRANLLAHQNRPVSRYGEREPIPGISSRLPDVSELQNPVVARERHAAIKKIFEDSKKYVRKHPKSTITAGLVGLGGLLYKIFEGTGTAISIGEAANKVYNTFADIYNNNYSEEGSGMRGNTELPPLHPSTSHEEKVATALGIASTVTKNIWEDSIVPEIMDKMSRDIRVGGFGAIPKTLYTALYGNLLRKIDALQGNKELDIDPESPEYLRYERDSFLDGAYTTSNKRKGQLIQGPNYRAAQRGEKDRMTTEEIVDSDINARKYVNERGSRGAVQTIPYYGVKPKRGRRHIKAR